MSFLAIDPGPSRSAYVVFTDGKLSGHATVPNETLLRIIEGAAAIEHPVHGSMLVVEMVQGMGMAVGQEVFETVFWVGRFCQAWPGNHVRLKRHQVKMCLCGNMAAKDGNIRQALIDLYGPGREKAIGKKQTPGPLYGVANDEWQALGLAVTFLRTHTHVPIPDAHC